MRPIISVDGRLCNDESDANLVISALDRGFTLGDGVFETMKGTGGTIWYLDRHLERLAHGAAVLEIALPPALRDWIDAVAWRAFAVAHSIKLRVTVSRGAAHAREHVPVQAPVYTPASVLAGIGAERPTVVVVATEGEARRDVMYTSGTRVHVASKPRNERGYTAGIKTTSYLELILGLREAVDLGFDDALFLDTRGMVSETSRSNVFAVLGDGLATPALTCGPLPGITRAVVLELARALGVGATEREIPIEEFLTATEAFTTSSVRGIVPLVGIGTCDVGNGTPGPVTRRLMAAYAAVMDRR